MEAQLPTFLPIQQSPGLSLDVSRTRLPTIMPAGVCHQQPQLIKLSFEHLQGFLAVANLHCSWLGYRSEGTGDAFGLVHMQKIHHILTPKSTRNDNVLAPFAATYGLRTSHCPWHHLTEPTGTVAN